MDANRPADQLAAICREYFVAILYVFGSRSQEASDLIAGRIEKIPPSSSDLDVGVLPVAGKHFSLREKVELGIRLEDFFQVNRVDLVVLPEAPPFLASSIVQGKRLFAQDQDQADEYDLYILRRAGDLLPFHRQRIQLILGGSV